MNFFQAVIAKRKRKEERKRLKEAAAAARGERPETSQESVVGRTTSAPEIAVLADVTPFRRLPESQTPSHLAPNTPAVRKKTKKSKKDRRPAMEPSRAVEVPVVQAVGPEIIEILDTDDEDFRPTTLVSSPSRAPTIQVSSSDAVAAVGSASGKKKKASTSKGKTSSMPQIPSVNTTAVASSSSREKTPIPQTSSPHSTTAHTSPPSQKKKVSSSKEKTEKAEKAARKQARAERRARKAERRAKRAGKDKDSITPVGGEGAVTGPNVGWDAGSMGREGKKKDKQKKTLRAAWTAGGRRDAPIDIDEEERYRSLSPLQVVDEDAQKEQEAQMRYEIMLQKLQNTAVPLKAPSEGIREEAWQAELRCSGNLTNAGLAAKGVWKGHSVSISS
jgi:hypothetical protein